MLFGSNRIPDRKFYIYDIDMDSFMQYEVSKNRVPVEAFWDQTDARLLAIETEYGKVGSGNDLNNGEEAKGSTPIGQIKDSEIEEDFRRGKEEEFQGKTLETFFVTTDYQVKRQDAVKFEEGEETLLGVAVPYFYHMGRKIENENEEAASEEEANKSSTMIILRKPMKDFVGLENVDESIKSAIMNFSHYLTVGNMDEAYNSVRNIKNNTVW